MNGLGLTDQFQSYCVLDDLNSLSLDKPDDRLSFMDDMIYGICKLFEK